MSIRRAKKYFGYAVVIIVLAGCGGPGDKLPPGMAHLRQGAAGSDFDAFVEEATVESERFRRRFLAGGDPDFVGADLLSRAIVKFREQTPFHLKGRKNIDSFDLSEETIVKAIAGAERISSDRAYGGFKGKWYGQWDKMSVDHHWGRLVEPEKPQRVEVAGDEPVWIRSYQYCWVGDGYGLNMIATGNPDSQSGDFLLGYVVHVEDGDLDRPTKRRPHVGIFVGEGKLIWITAGEVFLEESYVVSAGVDAYAITGFFYQVAGDSLQTTQCFQAVYTREPDNRPEWFSFPLELTVSR